MNRLISWLQNVLVRVTLTLLLVGIAFFFGTFLDNSHSSQAQAEPLTPEATQYQVNSNESPFREDAQEKVNAIFKDNKNPQEAPEPIRELGENLNKPQKNIKANLESAAENIKDKLNLDQPIYPGTKKFVNDVQEKAQSAVESPNLRVKY